MPGRLRNERPKEQASIFAYHCAPLPCLHIIVHPCHGHSCRRGKARRLVPFHSAYLVGEGIDLGHQHVALLLGCGGRRGVHTARQLRARALPPTHQPPVPIRVSTADSLRRISNIDHVLPPSLDKCLARLPCRAIYTSRSRQFCDALRTHCPPSRGNAASPHLAASPSIPLALLTFPQSGVHLPLDVFLGRGRCGRQS